MGTTVKLVDRECHVLTRKISLAASFPNLTDQKVKTKWNKLPFSNPARIKMVASEGPSIEQGHLARIATSGCVWTGPPSGNEGILRATTRKKKQKT